MMRNGVIKSESKHRDDEIAAAVADAVAQERRRIRDAVEILPTYGDARTVLCDRAHVLAAIESKPADSTEGDAECK
jgi:hypothetical protein